jgi:rhodanese-related sulfurtransferase
VSGERRGSDVLVPERRWKQEDQNYFLRRRSPMKVRRVHLIILALVIAIGVAAPAVGRDWIERPLVVAAERVLTPMPADFYLIDPAAVQRLMEVGRPLVIDVREAPEWAAGRIAGSVHIPIRTLPAEIAKLPEGRGHPIVVVCKAGVRGHFVNAILRMWGYTNVTTMRGGLDAWTAAGLAVTR